MRGRGVIRALAVAGSVAACAAPAAQAQSAAERASVEVFEDYQPDGTIDPCKHSAKTLQLALDSVPPDIEQYAADFPAALEAAIEARARGECDGEAGGTPGEGAGTPPASTDGGAAGGDADAAPAATAVPGATAAAGGQEVVPEPPAPLDAVPATAPVTGPDTALERAAAATASNDAPLPVLLLGALAAAIALTVLTVLAMRRLGLAEDRLAPAAHAWREAAWRAGGTWGDFRDWLRLGR